MKISWVKDGYCWRATIGDITLYAAPDHNKNGKPSRGTTWRAGMSQWDEPTRTINRYGRDLWRDQVASAKEAMRLAETAYRETLDA